MLGELSRKQIEDLLLTNIVGRIGCHAFGRTYVVPVTYMYDAGVVYGHGRLGMKFHMMRANPHVCFEVDMMDGFADWQSVIAWGVFSELHGDTAVQALDLLTRGFESRVAGPPGETVHPSRNVEPSIVYQIELQEKTGRYERRV